MEQTITKGYESLKASVERDCNKRNACGCFNPNGCNVENARIGKYGEEGYKSCFHRYCDKFKWTVDQAKHYGDKLQLNWEDVLASWEEDRSYWYMNYYQGSKQPTIKGDRVRTFETVQEMLESIGEKQFRCPLCEGISTSPYKCNSGQEMNKDKICDWNVGGLFGDLGKGIFVYCKDKLRGETIFTPLSWEQLPKAIESTEPPSEASAGGEGVK